jgi:hypothetical protein
MVTAGCATMYLDARNTHIAAVLVAALAGLAGAGLARENAACECTSARAATVHLLPEVEVAASRLP